jgi:hypothetical protein
VVYNEPTAAFRTAAAASGATAALTVPLAETVLRGEPARPAVAGLRVAPDPEGGVVVEQGTHQAIEAALRARGLAPRQAAALGRGMVISCHGRSRADRRCDAAVDPRGHGLAVSLGEQALSAARSGR